jgi:hypothetical protein
MQADLVTVGMKSEEDSLRSSTLREISHFVRYAHVGLVRRLMLLCNSIQVIGSRDIVRHD